MRRAPRPEPVGEADEVRLVDAVEHLHDGTLKDLVLKRRDPERALAPIRLRDIRPSCRLGPVAAAMDPTEQILEVALQIPPVGLPRHPVRPGRSPRVQCPIGRSQTVSVDVMQQRGEPCLLILHRPTAHAIQRT
jgi:hypothetical protein